jgi:hypothetical protein
MNKMSTQVDEQIQVNKILVVGHPLSGYESVAGVLGAGGMGPALSSKREGMLPAEISAALLKTHQSGVAASRARGIEYKQLSISPVWNTLALDLMLGNIDQPLWHWADAQAVSLLDFWKSVDSQLAFVLVYDAPQEFLMHAFDETETASAEEFNAKLSDWIAYNKTLLRFFHRNPGRTLLVHSRQAGKHAGGALLKACGEKGLAPLRTQKDASLDVTREETVTKSEPSDTPPENALRRYLATEVLSEHPDAMRLYEELQSVADLPFDDYEFRKTRARDAWSAAAKMKSEYRQELLESQEWAGLLEEENSTLESELKRALREHVAQVSESELLLEQLNRVRKTLETSETQSRLQIGALSANIAGLEKVRDEQADENVFLSSQLQKVREGYAQLQAESRQQLGSINENLAILTKERDDYAAEGELLLTQLHTVQEELEQLHIQSEKKIGDLNKELASMTKARDERIQRLEGEKKGLVEQVKRANRDREAEAGENELLLSQLHEVQEHLEQLHIQSKRKIGDLNRELAAMTKARDEQIQRLENEKKGLAEQVKKVNRDREAEAGENELLLSQLHAVQEHLEQLHLQSEQKIGDLNRELAAMTKARDAKAGLAQELKKRFEALQTKLESTEKERDQLARQTAQMVERSKLEETEQENELLLEQLHHVQEELERYYLENKNLKQKIPAAKPRPYGAAERVKQQLSYRLGATMIDRSRSFSGWVTMPTALMRETRQFRREFAERSKEKLPPLHHYTDAHEAERVKNHLSYRLGKAMVENGRTPIGWVKLPWALRKANVEYRKYRADV